MSSPGLLTGETGHEPSVSWGDLVTQTGWEGCSFLAAQPCLSELHIPTPACLGDHPVPLLSWDMVSVHTGSGRQAALSWSLPWHTSAQPWAAAQRAAKLAGSSCCFHPMLGSHLPAQMSTAPMPPTPHQQAAPPCCQAASLSTGMASTRDRGCCPHAGTVAMVESGPVPGRHFAGQIPMLAGCL